MADRRRGKQRRKEGEPDKPTKEEYAVAKHLRFNLPSREGKLVGMAVQYFIASKAVDMLLESKWGVSAKGDALFTSRNGCIDYCNNLLSKGIFHRAARIGKRKERDPLKKKKKLKDADEDVKESKEELLALQDKKQTKAEKRKEKKKDKKKEKEEEEDAEKDKEKDSEGEKEDKKGDKERKEDEKRDLLNMSESDRSDSDSRSDSDRGKIKSAIPFMFKDEERRKKKKVKLEMHDHQVFKDGDEIYVWIYDPVPFKTFVIGLLLVLGAVAVCMFPLWPPEVRLGIYYISLAAAGFVGVILALCVVRLILFCLVWALTFGRHHFWFLPNLTEDVGFFDSFRPLYKHDYCDNKPEPPPKDAVGDTEDKGAENTVKEIEEKKDGEKEEEKGSEKGSEKEESVEGSEDNGYEIVEREEFLQKEEGDQGEGEEEEDHSEEPKKTK